MSSEQESRQVIGSEEIVQQRSLGPQNGREKIQRRSKMDTYCDILRAIGGGAKRPTHIMYKANLSWNILQTCLEALQIQGLVSTFEDADSGRTGYELTTKGFELLNQYLSIRDCLSLS